MPVDLKKHKDEIRAKVEDACGEFPNDDGWDHWYGRLKPNDFIQVHQVVEHLVSEINAAGRSMPRRRTDPVEHHVQELSFDPPPWWASHCAARMGTYADIAEEVRAILYLDHAISLNEQDPLITDLLRRQQHGQYDSQVELEYARNALDRPQRLVERRTVYAGNTILQRNHEYVLNGAKMSTSNQPLFWLAVQARALSWESGCEIYQAVDYMLSGRPVAWTWIDVEPRRGSGVINLRIGTPIVPARDVARAYAQALAWEQAEQPGVLARAPKRRRRPRQRTVALLAFVHEHTAEGAGRPDWRDLQPRWDELYPDRPFRNPKAMSERYRHAAQDAAES